jgi:hypothetical protein
MRRLSYLPTATVILLVSALGCGKESATGLTSYSADSDQVAESVASNSSGGELNLALMQNPGGTEGDAPAKDADAPRLARKIIYNATLDLVVENLADVAAGVAELARKHDAFIAKSSIDTASGRPRSGSWTIRVPVARYDEFLNAAGALGELQRRTEDSREVTAEYYDLDTRIRNKHVEEERLLKHLTDSTGKLEDILAVERELSRVRTEVEQMQGQLRVLQDLTALSTVTLNAREIQGYVPAESPTFGTQISRAWRQSLGGLMAAAKVAVIAAVAGTPWLIVIGLPIMVAIWLRRRSLRRKREAGARP